MQEIKATDLPNTVQSQINGLIKSVESCKFFGYIVGSTTVMLDSKMNIYTIETKAVFPSTLTTWSHFTGTGEAIYKLTI